MTQKPLVGLVADPTEQPEGVSTIDYHEVDFNGVPMLDFVTIIRRPLEGEDTGAQR